MFAQAAWFQLAPMRHRRRHYLRPATWQGRAYAAAWGAAIALPTLALLSRGQLPEMLLWLAASLGTLLWDLRPVRQELRRLSTLAGEPTIPDAEVELMDDDADRLARRHSHHHCRRC